MDKTDSLQIRDARDSERNEMLEVTLSAYQEYAPHMSGHWEEYRQDIVETITGGGPVQRIVAELNGTIVGSVLLLPGRPGSEPAAGEEPRGELPEVRLLAVAPAARGRGIGAALIRECARRARRAGAAVLTLHTTDMMQVAVRMYERLGFVHTPELDFRPVPGVIVKGYSLDLRGTTP